MCALELESGKVYTIAVADGQLDQKAVHAKSDPETWVIKSTDEQRYLLTVAYAADLPDIGVARDGHIDFASKEVVEQAAWNFMRKGFAGQDVIGLWHQPGTAAQRPAEVVESYIYRGPDWATKSGLVVAGDWMLGMILTPDVWSMYKSGLITGVSPQGPCRRQMPSAEKLAELRSRDV